MRRAWEEDYKGESLPPEIEQLLTKLKDLGYDLEVTGRAAKTIRVNRGAQKVGYVNPSVIRRGVLGYYFGGWGRNSDAVPTEVAETIEAEFSKRYGCRAEDIVAHAEVKGDRTNTYAVIRSKEAALSVLAQDARTGR
jgi:hypothetical protein